MRHASVRDHVPLRYAKTLLRVAEAQGCNLDDLLRSLQLPFDPFGNHPEDALIDSRHYSHIYSRVMWLLQDESFGMHLRNTVPVGTFRMLCLCIIHCATLEHALKRAAEFTSFCRALTGSEPFNPRPIKRLDNGLCRYEFPSNANLLGDHDSRYEDIYIVANCIAIWRRFCGWIIGKNVELKEVWLQAEEPEDRYYLEQLFGCDIRFGQAQNAYIFSDHYLDCPLVHTEDSLKDFLRNAPYHMLVSNDEEDTSLIAQMKRIIGNDLSRDFPSVVTMASHLNMSVRTLRRRLKDQDTTYQQFKDNLRKEHAIRWLNQPELKINAVSALLGFDEPSAFHRSFKKWTGMTPGEYRANRQNNREAKAS